MWAEEHFLNRFAGHSAVVAQMSARVPIVANSVRYVVEPLAFGGLVLAVIVLSIRGRNFSDILPNLGVMAVAGYRLLPTLQLLYGQVSQITSMRYSLDGVFEEFVAAEHDEKSGSVESSAPKPRPLKWDNAITLDEISFAYPGSNRLILDRFSATIQKNTSIGFIGPTGSGKSTLIDLLLGLHEPTSGHVLIDCEPLTRQLIPSWQATIGYVPRISSFSTIPSLAISRSACQTTILIIVACKKFAPWPRSSTLSKRSCGTDFRLP
jgi:ABC-type multidrug transport system fused ATPase/permease subunit